ncbi:unnamed protein product, partial [Urochloa humidicola]
LPVAAPLPLPPPLRPPHPTVSPSAAPSSPARGLHLHLHLHLRPRCPPPSAPRPPASSSSRSLRLPASHASPPPAASAPSPHPPPRGRARSPRVLSALTPGSAYTLDWVDTGSGGDGGHDGVVDVDDDLMDEDVGMEPTPAPASAPPLLAMMRRPRLAHVRNMWVGGISLLISKEELEEEFQKFEKVEGMNLAVL